MEFSSSFYVPGNLIRLVRNEESCFPWSFFAPSSEDLAWNSNEVDATRFFRHDFSCGPYLQLRIAVRQRIAILRYVFFPAVAEADFFF